MQAENYMLQKTNIFPTILSETLLQKSYQNFQIVPMMMDLITFRKFVETLQISQLSTKKYIRGNNSPFMNKTLSKKIMKQSNLRSKYLKSRSEEDRQSYSKQGKLYVSLLRKSKRSYYSTLNENIVIDNRNFWKTFKRMLSNKLVNSEKITLVQNEKIITDDKGI